MASYIIYTQASIAEELAGKADAVHTHPDKADVNHTHSAYALVSHTHADKANLSHTHAIADLTATGPRDDTHFLRGDGTWSIPPGTGGGGTGGVTDHGALTGLADDDHPQYHTDARGDARYSRTTHTHTADGLTDATVTGKALVRAVDAAAARALIGASTLALGTTATTAMAGNKTFTKAEVGLANVDNTADASKPVSTAQSAAITDAVGSRSLKSVTQAMVYHDGTPGGGTRPSGYFRVLWVNPVGTNYARPTNMAIGDEWEKETTV
jgi:hypothetical protein